MVERLAIISRKKVEKISLGKSILLTRPINQSRSFEKMLLKSGVKNPIIIAPMAIISLKKIFESDYEEIKAFIVSSTNAIEAIKHDSKFLSYLSRKKIPIYCVGKRTTEVGKAIGLETIFYGFSAADLIKRIRNKLVDGTFHAPPKEICFLRGNKITINISSTLGICEKVVYCQIPNELYSDIKLKVIMDDVGYIFFFSKNTVDLFFEKISDIKSEVKFFCFSESIRNRVLELLGTKKSKLYFCKRPVASDLVSLFLSKK